MMSKTTTLRMATLTLFAWLMSLCFAQEGKLELVFKASSSKAHKDIRAVLSKSQYLADMVTFFSDRLELPQDIPVRFEDCGEENAFYYPDGVYISMCYELIEAMANLESDLEVSKEDRYLDATNATLLHELGHALAHQLELPITGKEEDAADEFSVLALLKLNDEAGILASIYQYQTLVAQMNPEEQIYWDSHSLDAQRMYDMVCLVYGSNPEAYAELAGTTDIPEDRLAECEFEYQDALYAWNTILEPYLTDPEGPLLLEPDN
jgi:phosphotransferase system HPr-like phosphotransfer protein